MKSGSYVTCVKDKVKIIYIIESMKDDIAYIKGLYYRIAKLVPLSELNLAESDEIAKEEKKTDYYQTRLHNLKKRDERKYLLGRVLHLDGDEHYLDKCVTLYKSLGVSANGFCIHEKQMAKELPKLIYELNPDVVVITGHDIYNQNGLKDLENYSNTNHFIEAIKSIRKIKSRYDCTIVAGACQSNFEALIAAGADFASSPKRINIHTFDPVVIATRVASTSITKIVNLDEALKYIDNGRDAYGGLETLGKMRLML